MLAMTVKDLIIIILLGVIILIWLYYNSKFNKLKKLLPVHPTLTFKDFPDLYAVLQWHMERAYKIIYKDKILVYSAEGMTVKEDEYTLIQKEFIKLTLDLMGPSFLIYMLWLFGDEQVLYRNMCIYFDEAYENDSLRRQTMASTTNLDIDISKQQQELSKQLGAQ